MSTLFDVFTYVTVSAGAFFFLAGLKYEFLVGNV